MHTQAPLDEDTIQEEQGDEELLLRERRHSVAEKIVSRLRSNWESLRGADWKFWGHVITLMSVIFVGEAARGLVVPSLFLYLEELGGGKSFLGIVVAVFSVGRLIGSVGLGWWYNARGPKEVLIGSLIISTIGNLLYGFGYVTDKWVVLVGRFLVGFGSGTLAPIRAAIADITTKDQRVRFMALSNGVQFIGFAIVPGLAALLTLVDFYIGGLRIDKYSSAGFVLALINGIAILGTIFFIATPTEHNQYKFQKDLVKDEEEEEISQVWLWIGILLFITLNLVTRGVLAILETVGAPIFVDVWDSDNASAVTDSSRMFLILGAIGLVTYLLVDYIRRLIPEHLLLSASFALTGVGAMLFITWGQSDSISLAEFIAGSVLIWSIASPVAQTLILSTFSKMLGTRPQGSAMGWIGSAGSIGRIVFPLLAGVLSHNASFITSAIVSFFCAVAVLLYRVPVKEYVLKMVPLRSTESTQSLVNETTA